MEPLESSSRQRQPHTCRHQNTSRSKLSPQVLVRTSHDPIPRPCLVKVFVSLRQSPPRSTSTVEGSTERQTNEGRRASRKTSHCLKHRRGTSTQSTRMGFVTLHPARELKYHCGITNAVISVVVFLARDDIAHNEAFVRDEGIYRAARCRSPGQTWRTRLNTRVRRHSYDTGHTNVSTGKLAGVPRPSRKHPGTS